MAPTMYDRYTEDLLRKKNSKRATLGFAAVKSVTIVVTHPIDYGKALIQMGYEPVPPYSTTTLLGKPAIGLPGIFGYLSYIKERDGFLGLWRGLQPKLVCVGVSSISYQAGLNFFDWLTDSLPQSPSDLEIDDEVVESNTSKVKKAGKSLVRECTGKTVAVLCSHPFHVITLRCMAQFIGRETRYQGLLSSVRSVVSDNGWVGFFSGLVPRLTGELCTVALVHGLVHATRIGFPDMATRIGQGFDFTTSVIQLVATSVTYPFTVVGTCMAVSGSGLLAGGSPHMPVFVSWTDAWTQLSHHNQLERGSSILKRYYKGSPNLGLSVLSDPPTLAQFRDPKIKLM